MVFEHPRFGKLRLVGMLTGHKVEKGHVLMTKKNDKGKFETNAYALDKLPFVISSETLKKYGYKSSNSASHPLLQRIEEKVTPLYRNSNLEFLVVGEASKAEIKDAIRVIFEEEEDED